MCYDLYKVNNQLASNGIIMLLARLQVKAQLATITKQLDQNSVLFPVFSIGEFQVMNRIVIL